MPNRLLAASLRLLVLLLLLLPGARALAGSSNLRVYDFDRGLTSLGGTCMLQDLAGYLIVCTEHGLFTYDGRRFVNLGPAQGLREGGNVTDVVMTARGRIAAGYADNVFVADRATGPIDPPDALRFRSLPTGSSAYEATNHRLVAWRDGLAMLIKHKLAAVSLDAGRQAQPIPMGYSPSELAALDTPARLFVVRGALWTASDDGTICRAEPGSVRCYGQAEGLPRVPWLDLLAGTDRQIVARSSDSIARFDPQTHRWTVEKLPDQGGSYLNYTNSVGIFRAPDGTLMTQAAHGLVVLRADGWHQLTVEDGAPPGVITGAMTDRTGQLWFHILGVGLVRWIGYGRWDSIPKSDGLSDGQVWATARPSAGSIWAATDTGIARIGSNHTPGRIRGIIPGGSYAMATARDGRVWSGLGSKALRVIDPTTLRTWVTQTPAVNAFAMTRSGIAWVGTEQGLIGFKSDGEPTRLGTSAGVPSAPVLGITGDGGDGAFYISGAVLRHRYVDGTDIEISHALPASGFDPYSIARQSDGTLWVAGGGGALRIVCRNDRVSSVVPTQTSETRSNTIFALLIDHRGWIWMGTSFGVSVFNGRSWSTIDTDRGLLANEVNANGLYEDWDGSVWITTSQGLSHLLDPVGLFGDAPIRVLIAQADIGNRHVTSTRIPYSHEALSVQFGTPDYGAEHSIVFRYSLSGVDAAQVESANGVVRYPFVPPGRHELVVVAYDTLTHAVSEPVRLVVDMAFPWWRQWWSEIGFVLLAFTAVYAFLRLRLRVSLGRQNELKRLVAEATEEIRLAETELRYRAAHDSLTGLLNRAEIERRLPARLAGQLADEAILVALLDVDHFKRVNDAQGHIGGDNVLRALGRLVARAIRVGEDAGRYGGEEILLVLDDTDRAGAARIANLQHAVRQEAFGPADAQWHVTCSIGLAWARAGDGWESLVGRADDALYEAKHAGRDRIVESRRTSRPTPGPDLKPELDRLAAIAQNPSGGLVPDGLIRS